MKAIPTPRESLVTVSLIIFPMVAIWGAETLLLPTTIKAVAVPVSAAVLCGFLVINLPSLSPELRARSIGIILCQFLGVECGILAGSDLFGIHGLISFFVVMAFVLFWFTKCEPAVYKLLGGKEN